MVGVVGEAPGGGEGCAGQRSHCRRLILYLNEFHAIAYLRLDKLGSYYCARRGEGARTCTRWFSKSFPSLRSAFHLIGQALFTWQIRFVGGREGKAVAE